MEIWLKQEGVRFRVPVLPSEYSVTSSQNNTTVLINALGEMNLLGKPGLREISFSSFFPVRAESYCEYSSIPSPKDCVSQLEKMKRKGKLKLLITGTGIRMDCAIESFEYGENDGTGDVSYTLSLKEYIPIQISKSEINSQQLEAPVLRGESRVEQEPEEAESYTVKNGDCLSAIARAKTGNASNWKKIYDDNRDVIGANPNRLYSGQVLIINY